MHLLLAFLFLTLYLHSLLPESQNFRNILQLPKYPQSDVLKYASQLWQNQNPSFLVQGLLISQTTP